MEKFTRRLFRTRKEMEKVKVWIYRRCSWAENPKWSSNRKWTRDEKWHIWNHKVVGETQSVTASSAAGSWPGNFKLNEPRCQQHGQLPTTTGRNGIRKSQRKRTCVVYIRERFSCFVRKLYKLPLERARKRRVLLFSFWRHVQVNTLPSQILSINYRKQKHQLMSYVFNIGENLFQSHS